MPYTMNGIGTWYYGKKNVFTHADFCPNCRRHVTLSSYDTREWFVVLFVPIIPLGQKRIMDACPTCTKHRRLSLKKYLKAKQEAYAEAEGKYNAAPNDVEAAGQLLQAYAAYQDLTRFDELAPDLLEQFSSDARMFNTVGMIHFQYGRMEQAQNCFEQSLLLYDDDEIRYLLGIVSVRLADPDSAARYFQFITDKAVRGKAGSLFMLVDAYQAQGRHAEALSWLDRICALDPGMAENKEYKKSRKLSEKHLDSGKPIKNKQFTAARKEKTPVSGKKVLAIAAMVLLAIGLILSGVSFYMGTRAHVYLVNGLDRPYEIELNGTPYVLPKYSHQKIAVSEGDLSLSVKDAALEIQPAVLSVHSPFWKRPFLDRVYVINPDSIALIERVKAYYHENTNKAPDPEWDLFYGQRLHVFDGVQCPFRELPTRISSSGGGLESRVQIRLLDKTDIPVEQIAAVIEEEFGVEAKISYLKQLLYAEPDNLKRLNALYVQTDAALFIEAIQPGLEVVPPRVEWHRFYQNAMDVKNPVYDLAAEYKARLDNIPENADMQYLYGRTLHKDRDKAEYWFARSTQGTSPSAYGYFALGYDAMAAGDFEAALKHYQQAMMLYPDHPYYCTFCVDMLIATGRLDKAEELCRIRMSQKPQDHELLLDYVDVLREEGKTAEAERVFEQWCSSNNTVFTEEDFANLRESDQLNAAYMNGDFKAIEEIVGEPNDLWARLLVTFNGDRPISHEILARADSFPPKWLLLCYISAVRHGNPEDAELFWAEAGKRFGAGSHGERFIARCFEPGAKPDANNICTLAMETDVKAVTLTALGLHFSEHREQFFALARRLNFKKEFPYHYLNAVLDEPMAARDKTI